MAKYSVVFKSSVAKDLSGIPNHDVQKILTKIDALALNPRAESCIKLSGHDNYRVRQGMYRIVYQIRDLELAISVIKVGHRSALYKSN